MPVTTRRRNRVRTRDRIVRTDRATISVRGARLPVLVERWFERGRITLNARVVGVTTWADGRRHGPVLRELAEEVGTYLDDITEWLTHGKGIGGAVLADYRALSQWFDLPRIRAPEAAIDASRALLPSATP